MWDLQEIRSYNPAILPEGLAEINPEITRSLITLDAARATGRRHASAGVRSDDSRTNRCPSGGPDANPEAIGNASAARWLFSGRRFQNRTSGSVVTAHQVSFWAFGLAETLERNVKARPTSRVAASPNVDGHMKPIEVRYATT
jgi:hypothetical protein